MVALLREQLADMRQQRDHRQIEAADWKRQAQNLPPPPQPSATSGNLGNRSRNRACNDRQPAVADVAIGLRHWVRATMDEIGEHAWIISIVGDFLTLFGLTGDSPCSIARPRASGRDLVEEEDGQRSQENTRFKQSNDARAGLVCVAVGAGFQIVSKLIEEFIA